MFAFIRKVVRAAVVLVTLSAVFLLGGAVFLSASRLWHETQNLCYVADAIVVACQRQEEKDAYIWNVVAIRNEGSLNEEVIFIKHKVPKAVLFYAF